MFSGALVVAVGLGAAPAFGADPLPAEPPAPAAGDPEAVDTGFLPPGLLFAQPVADRRWPRFEAGVERSYGDANITSAFAVGIGGTVPLWRSAAGDLEAGVQAGVFSTFDREAPSLDLYNSDYVAALYVAGRSGETSWMVRGFHTSTHLGDEFVLRNPQVKRENLSFERLDGFASREFRLTEDPLRLRAYAGLGVVVGEPKPSDWGHLRGQWGLELRRPLRGVRWAGLLLAADVQHEDARGFAPDLSLVGGLEVPAARLHSALQVLATYYTGRSPNGQFWRDHVQVIGLRAGFTF